MHACMHACMYVRVYTLIYVPVCIYTVYIGGASVGHAVPPQQRAPLGASHLSHQEPAPDTSSDSPLSPANATALETQA